MTFSVSRKMNDGTWDIKGEGYSSEKSAKNACVRTSTTTPASWRVHDKVTGVTLEATIKTGSKTVWSKV